MSGLGRLLLRLGLLILYVGTVFIVPLLKRALRRHCPDCNHLLARHEHRADGSFKD